ncbi:MAG: NAD-dependent epimerase/dehydratase family protein [Rhodothermia bacterium]
MTGKSAFVTGGTGFVGSHLVEHLLANGYDQVKCLVRSDPKWLRGMSVELVKGDLSNLTALKNAVRGVEYVYHVGGLTRAKTLDELRHANVTGTLTLMRAVDEAAPYVRKILVMSSLSTVGQCDTDIADEDTPLRPISMYGQSKAEMEKELEGWTSRLPLTIVRPAAVYGPRESDIYTFFKAASRGFSAIVGQGREPEVNLVYATDVARGAVEATESTETTGKIYFLGSERQYSWVELRDAVVEALGRRVFTINIPPSMVERVGGFVEKAAGLVGKYPPLNREKAREILDACKMCSVDRAKADFGYNQEISLEIGVRRTVAWYQDKGWL